MDSADRDGVERSGRAVPITFSAGGSNQASSIQATVDAFRTALGSPNNGNAPGGRREINWDGGTATDGTPAVTPSPCSRTPRGSQLLLRGAA